MYEGDTLDELLEKVKQVHLEKETFKVYFLKINDLDSDDKIPFSKRREIERSVGLQI